MIKVIIADDHPIVREGLKKILGKTPDLVIVDDVGSGEELLIKVSANEYDVVLLDLSLPGRGGLEILEQLRKEKPKLPVLVLSIHPEKLYAVRVLKAGASGYLNKDEAPAELLKAIRKVFSGGKYVSTAVAEILAADLEAGHETAPHELLSNREYQVMRLIASGKTVKAVAAELSLSSRTVSTYRSRVLQKMKLNNNAELTYYAIKNGLVD